MHDTHFFERRIFMSSQNYIEEIKEIWNMVKKELS